MIIEANDAIGGRLAPIEFGKDANGKPYLVERGANWVWGLCAF